LTHSGIHRNKKSRMKMSGRFRHTSIQSPTGTLSHFFFEIRPSARNSPKISDRTMQISAISMFTRNAFRMKLALLPANSHSQLAGSKR
jgi:hypothetical protein